MVASVSIIIPCYCCSSTVTRAMESVTRQTLLPMEVILVDDCSPDDTLTTLLQLQQKYGETWVKVISLEENCGPSVARNKGWDVARGDYIAFLDADDAWHPQKLDRQYSWMISNSNALLSGHVHPLVTHQLTEFLPKDFTTHLVTSNEILLSNLFETSSVMLKREIAYRFSPTQRYCEDHLLWMQLCLDGYSLYIFDQQMTQVFKSFGAGGLTKHLFKMRQGYISNCWQMFKGGKINLYSLLFYTIYSSVKMIPLMILGYEKYDSLKVHVATRYLQLNKNV